MLGRKSLLDSSEKSKFDAELAFTFWAFGDSIPPTKELKRDAWNVLHGDKLYLAPTDKIAESLSRMIRIYCNDCQNNNYFMEDDENNNSR